MSTKILINRFGEKNFAVGYGIVQFQAEWNRDTGLSVSVLAREKGYAKNYLEPHEAAEFSKWLNECLEGK